MVFPLKTLAEDGIRASLALSSRVESTQEKGYATPQREGERLVTGLSFRLGSETRSQSLSIAADTDLSYTSSEDDAFDIESPQLRLNYSVESRQSKLDLSARYRRAFLDAESFLDDEDAEDIETGEGSRTNASIQTGLTFGRESPVTLSLNHLYARTTYSGQIDGDPSDSTTQRAGATLSLRVSPVVNANLFGTWSEVDGEDEDATDRTSRSMGLGASYDLTKSLTLTGSLSYDEITSTTSDDTEGFGYALGLNQDRPNGSLRLDLSRNETINGPRDQISFGQTTTLPSGNLSYSLGLSRTGDTDVSSIASLSFSRELTATSTFRINASQANITDSDDNETLRSALGLTYAQDINSISSISFGANFTRQAALDDAGTDRDLISANLNYRRSLGGEWDMVTGYRHSASRREDAEDRSSDTVFLGLEKTFDW